MMLQIYLGNCSDRYFRYSKSFTTIEPILFNVCQYWFNKDQNRIRDIRADTLSQILNLANIRPGGRYIAVDDASGLIVSGILEKMGGMEARTEIALCIRSPVSLRGRSFNHNLRHRFTPCVSGHGEYEFQRRHHLSRFGVTELGDGPGRL
jgi:hypothetical protein